MPEDYTVQSGDCMSSIAYTHGFFWETLWNSSENSALRTKRKDPNVLMTGDSVHIPDLTVKQESRPTDARHKFKLKGVPETLSIRLLDIKQQPRANLDYVITIDGISRRGTTDANGELKESIPPNAKAGQLVVPPLPDEDGKPNPKKPQQVMQLQLGNLDPVSEVSGFKARLANLRYYRGAVDGKLDGATKKAIQAFQKEQGLPVTGAADDATQAQLLKLHGH